MPALNRVNHEKEPFLVAELSQAEQILHTRGCHASFSLNPFNQDRNGARRKRFARRIEVIVRHVPKTWYTRLEALLHLFLAGRGDSRERAPVKRVGRGQDFVPPL